MQIEGVSSKVSLPFRWNLIKTFGGKVGLDAVLVTRGFKQSFQVFSWGDNGFFDVTESVENVEAEAEF